MHREAISRKRSHDLAPVVDPKANRRASSPGDIDNSEGAGGDVIQEAIRLAGQMVFEISRELAAIVDPDGDVGTQICEGAARIPEEAISPAKERSHDLAAVVDPIGVVTSTDGGERVYGI